MRGSAKDAPVLSGSRWHGRGDLDAVPGGNGSLWRGENASSGVHTSPPMVTNMTSSKSSRRRPRRHQHYNPPPSKTRRGSHDHISGVGFSPVARDTYYRDRQVKVANSVPGGRISVPSDSTAPDSNIGRGRGGLDPGELHGGEHGYCRSVVNLGEPTTRALRRPWPNASRYGGTVLLCSQSDHYSQIFPGEHVYRLCI